MGETLKIIHIIAGFGIDFPGGITNYVRTLAASQARSGHEVIVVDGGGSNRSHELGFSVLSYSGGIRPFVVSCKEDQEGTSQLKEMLVGESADLIHFHLTVGFGEDFYEDFAGSGQKYVISMHDYYLLCPRITMMNWEGRNCGGPERKKCETCIGKLDQIDLLYKAARRIQLPLPRIPSTAVTARNAKVRAFLRGAKVVLPVSDRVRQLSAGPYPELNYEVAHIGNVSASVDRPDKTASPNLRLTFIGVLSEHKGADLFINLARGVTRKDVEFHFFGRAERKWAAAAKKVGIIIHGSYSPADLPEIMASTDLGVVLPIWEDNGPQVVMEFVNYGVPVLATRMGGIPDFVTGDNGFLFNTSAVSDAIAYVDAAETEELRSIGRSLPRLTSPEEHQEHMMGVYEKALLPA